MRAARRRKKKSRNGGPGLERSAHSDPWQPSACAPGERLVLLLGSFPAARLPCPGPRDSQHGPGKPRVALRVLAMLVDLFAGSGLCGDGKSWCPLETAPQDCWHAGGVAFRFPPYWEITWFFLKWIASLNPRFSRNMETVLLSTFLSTLNTLRLNCRFSVILPSQVKARKEIQSIPPARTLANLLSCGPQVGVHLCFRNAC